MRTPGRLASVLNGIVISTLSACGSAAEGDHPGGVGTTSEAGGDAAAGGTTSGSGGRLQTAGTNSGGSAVLAAGGDVSTGGVGTAGNGGGGSVSVVSKPQCDAQGLLQFVEGLHLPEPVDYLGVYFNQSPGNNALYQSTGTLCGGASDTQACQTAFVAGTPSAGFPFLYQYPPILTSFPSYAFMFLAYTRGDSVGFIVDRDQLNAFLGEIDSANEAGLAFLSMGVGPTCTGISETPEAYYYSTFSSVPCSIMPPGHMYSVTRSGQVASIATGMAMPCVGRRPVGLVDFPRASANATPLGDYYASVAHLEGAAVLAFDNMERELKRFGAPLQLQLRARRARADEKRHYNQMAAHARREGAAVPCVEAPHAGERSLLAAALENAIEGCVRETWGALSAHYQASAAFEPEARQLWRDIACEESEHAELSLALHDWLMPQLSIDDQEIVEAAIRRARLQLHTELELGSAPHPSVVKYAGVPEPIRAAALFSELERQVLETMVRRAA